MNILVTGAAGLVGGALVAALTTAGHAVIGVVHQTTGVYGNDGCLIGTAHVSLSVAPAGMMTLQGDVRRHGLGLGPATHAWLDRHIDVVIHCAALVQFEANASDLQAVNVNGTLHVAQLCPDARFIHVSTAYVCGLRDGMIAETACDPGGAFGNGYEHSKAQAETLVRRMRPDAIIARPSIIVGEAATGRIRNFDSIYRAFKLIAEGKIVSVPVLPTATLNFVPIDYVVAGICDLCDNANACGQILHLAAREAIGAAQFLSFIGKIPGLCSPLIAACHNGDATARSLAERLAQSYFGYFRRSPNFATQALERLSGRVAPAMDAAALTRQIHYCVDAGFIRARYAEAV